MFCIFEFGALEKLIENLKWVAGPPVSHRVASYRARRLPPSECAHHTYPMPLVATVADRHPPSPRRPTYAAATLSPKRLRREGKHQLLSTSPLPLLVTHPTATAALSTPPCLKPCVVVLVRPSIAVERCSHPRDKPTVDAPLRAPASSASSTIEGLPIAGHLRP
jgi:hypothetical protein